MNGEWLGSRAIRVNWANQKTQTGGGRTGGDDSPAGAYGSSRGGSGMGSGSSYGGSGGGASSAGMSYEQVVAQTPEYNSTVYVGNLIPYTTQADLIPLFQGYGYIVEIRMQADRGFAFVKLDTHQNAALAIVQLQNQLVHGRPVKCSWGKDKPPGDMGHGGHGHHGHGHGGHGGYGHQQHYGGHGGYGQQQQYPQVCTFHFSVRCSNPLLMYSTTTTATTNTVTARRACPVNQASRLLLPHMATDTCRSRIQPAWRAMGPMRTVQVRRRRAGGIKLPQRRTTRTRAGAGTMVSLVTIRRMSASGEC